jgi:hypothetical protein
MDGLVAFTCAAPAHRDTEAGPDKLTVHEGKWAYCGYDARADGHQWKANDGIAISLLQHPAAIRDRIQGKDPSETR